MKKIKRVDDWKLSEFLIKKGCRVVDEDNKGRKYFVNDDWLNYRLEWFSIKKFN